MGTEPYGQQSHQQTGHYVEQEEDVMSLLQ